MLQAAPSTSSPRNSPQVHVGAGPADRVLLLGNGVLHGWGVQLREMTVTGQLAQLLHERTGRATVVDLIGEERMTAASALPWLGDAAGRGHDLAVVCLGLNDALRLTPVEEWRRHVAALVEHLLAVQHPHAMLLLVGLPHVRAFLMADSTLGSIAQTHADRLDAVLVEIAAAHPGVVVLPAPQEQFEPDRPIGSPQMYRAWAEQLLPDITRHLDTVRALKAPADPVEEHHAWVGAATAITTDGSATHQRLDALTEEIRERFGVASVGVNLITAGEVISLAGLSGTPRRMPRALAYCDRTVTCDAPTLIPDRTQDPDFADNAFLDVVGLPFYAGVPLHATDGAPVATLCALDTAARTDIDPLDLQHYAATAEALLRSFEPDAAPAHPDPTGPVELHPHDEPGPHDDPGPRASTPSDSFPLRLTAAALRPVIALALGKYLRRQVRPHWDHRAITPGPDPMRVLIFGAGIAVGYGSDGAADPWPAQIAEALHQRTGRGVIVETRARPSVPLEEAYALLGRVGAATYDHVIWSPTLEEATRGSSRRWLHHLRRIISQVQASGPAHQHLTLLGLPLIDGEYLRQRIGRILGRDVNDRISTAAHTATRTSYLPLPHQNVPDWDTPLFDAAYRTRVTALLVHHLLTQHTRPTPVSPVPALIPELQP